MNQQLDRQPNFQSNKRSIYDLIIVGAGPAGLTASIYASRYHLSNLVIGKIVGGTITLAHKVQNFPGLPGISGAELGQKIAEQAKALGAEILMDNVDAVEKTDQGQFKVFAENGQELLAKTLIVATGTERKELNVPGEREYLGKGVSYCVTCDAPFFKDKTVALVGGSNAACSGAIHVADFAKKVFIVYRRDQLRAEPAWVEEALANPKIEVIYDTNVKRILGGEEKQSSNLPALLRRVNRQAGLAIKQLSREQLDRVAAVELDKSYQNSKFLPVEGVFIEIGGAPLSSLLNKLGVKTGQEGYVETDSEMATNIAGIFAAGDVTAASCFLQQAITACAQGAIAAASAYQFLKNQKAPRQIGAQ